MKRSTSKWIFGGLAAALIGWIVFRPRTAKAEVIIKREHVVAPGESLSAIAAAEYGDAALWPLVWDANRDVLTAGPDRLEVGMKLAIPAAEGFTPELVADARRRFDAHLATWRAWGRRPGFPPLPADVLERATPVSDALV